ncbi:MAG: hypothetical protein ACR2OM_01255 [Aestuariivirgaceae bacterium]
MSMKVQVLICGLLAMTVIAGVPDRSIAAERFVPQGHTYSPDEDRLPLLNTRRDRINSQADLYEAEIYRVQKERAILEGELGRHIQHDFSGGANFRPRYD